MQPERAAKNWYCPLSMVRSTRRPLQCNVIPTAYQSAGSQLATVFCACAKVLASALRRPGSRMHRTVFFISDSTGITAETIGNSILAQFEGVQFDKHRLPFTDNAHKAETAALRIDRKSTRLNSSQ